MLNRLRLCLKNLIFCLVFALFTSCAGPERPAAKLASDFDSRRPVTVAVLPTVYAPHLQPNTFEISETKYLQLLLEAPNPENIVLAETQKAVRKTFEDRGIAVVDQEKMNWAMGEFRKAQQFSFEQLTEMLRADSLAFVTLFRWDLKNLPYESRGKVLIEVALYNSHTHELIWLDRSFPEYIQMPRSLRNPYIIPYFSKESVASVFESFPIQP